MKLLVLGATGGVGRRLVAEALDQGHEVTALTSHWVRDEIPHERLRRLTWDKLDPSAVEAALAGREAVLWAPGDVLAPRETELSDEARMVTAAMERLGPRRLVFLSSLNLANIHRRGMLVSAVLMLWLFQRGRFRDAETQERIVRESTLDWTTVRAGTLFDGPRQGNWRLSLGDADVPADARVSYADAADFMLRQVTDVTYLRATVGLFY
jgi:putative NADH-flavin reductase